MARVSLVVPKAPETPLSPARIAEWRHALEAAGHWTEVLVVNDQGPETPARPDGLEAGTEWWSLAGEDRGLATAALVGLRAAEGEIVLVLDPTRGYDPADLARVVEPLEQDRGEVAVASRWEVADRSGAIRRRRLAACAGALARPLVGTSDPLTGLVGLTREAFLRAEGSFCPAGGWFAFELLAKVEGRVVDVPVRVQVPPRRERLAVPRPGLEEIRHLKRLADHRFGNVSRLLQFCVVGASGMVVDLTCYVFFKWVLGRAGWLAGRTMPLIGGPLALAIAAALAIAVALTWNFSLNRRLTFSYARRGSIVRQYVSYALSNALGIALSFTLRLWLPRRLAFFDRHKLAAAVVGIVTATGINFALSRWVVFSPQKASGPSRRVPSPPHSALVETSSAR